MNCKHKVDDITGKHIFLHFLYSVLMHMIIKKATPLFAISALILISGIVSGCDKKTDTPSADTQSWNVASGAVISGTIQVLETHKVGGQESEQRLVYGTIIAWGVRNVNSSIAGILEDVRCEPGQEVTPDTIIGRVVPDKTDTIIKNSKVQAAFLNRQIQNLQDIIDSTRINFSIQDTTLQNQLAANSDQKSLLERNFNNLSLQRENNTDDVAIQLDTLEEQLYLLESSRDKLLESQKADFDRTTSSVGNTRTQVRTFAWDATESLDQFLGVSQSYSDQRLVIDRFLGTRDSGKKAQLYGKVSNVLSKKSSINDMNDEQLSIYLQQLGETLQSTIEVLNISDTGAGFSAADIAAAKSKFNSFLNLSTTYKTNLDNSTASETISQNSYDTQLNTLDANIASTRSSLDNLRYNRYSSSDLSFDTNANTLRSQIINLELASQNLAQQKKSNRQSQEIQVAQLENQLFSLQQNVAVLENTINEETLVANVYGVIKSRKNDSQNKVSANTAVCQISVSDPDGATLQFYSPELLAENTVFSYSQNGNVLWTGRVDRVAPFVDPATQNFTYETTVPEDILTEWQKIEVQLWATTKATTDTQVFIPVTYVIPKLEGNFVRIQRNGVWEEKKVSLGQLDGTNIEILSGVSQGDLIGR